MVIGYYFILCICSFICTWAYMFKWHRHFNVHFTLIYTIVPLVNLGYLALALSSNLQEAILANKIIYVGASFFPLLSTLCIMHLCKVRTKKSLAVTFFSLSAIVYGCALSIGYSDIYYKNVSFTIQNGAGLLIKEYGPMHILFYVAIIGYMLFGMSILVRSYITKRKVSLKNLHLLLYCELLNVFSYIFGRVFIDEVEWLPLSYVITQIIFLIIISRISLYDVNVTVIDSLLQNNDIGFISFDWHKSFLGNNLTAEYYLPELDLLRIDKPLPQDSELFKMFHEAFQELDNTEGNVSRIINRDKKNYRLRFGYLYDGRTKRGYQITISDETQQQQYINLLNDYNTTLEYEVEKKTKHIQDIQDKMILAIADIIENRDNSTGGHIKRTSEVVSILVHEMQKDETLGLTSEFCQNVIKAAPMHDLGKIAIDDDILKKPGKFTPEEFEEMKKHAAKGADIVHAVLEGIDDRSFQTIAENVAHYHHERWDGSGYPCKMKGEEIPLEARIMAIADVYDALVSKRCYKNSMSFEEAFQIIQEGMGTQFDAQLNKYFVGCHRQLEEYYS